MKRQVLSATVPLAVFAGLVLASCSSDESPTAPESSSVARVEVTAPTQTLTALGETVQLQASAKDAKGNAISGASFTWQSSSTDIITVSDAGLATAVANGTVRITARTSGVSGQLTLTARQTPAQLAIRTQPSGAVLAEPLTTQPVIEVQDANGNVVSGDNLTSVAASIGSGGGMLVGGVTASANRGVITFADLAIAGSVGNRTLVFAPAGRAQASDLTPVTSATFDLLPGAADAVLQLSGDGQLGIIGELLNETLVVIATNSAGDAAAGESTTWEVIAGGGSIEAADATTDAQGLSKGVWRLGAETGDNAASVTVAGKGTATFTARGILDPEAPLPLVATALEAASEAPLAGVYVHGKTAFVGGMSTGYNTSSNIGVRIVDLSNPGNPRLVGRIPLRTRQQGANHSHGDAVATHIETGAFQGDVAIVLEGVPNSHSVSEWPQPYGIWDVTDPSTPSFLSAVQVGNHSHGVGSGGELGDRPLYAKDAAGNYFYALYQLGPSISTTGLAVVDLSDPRNPIVVGDWPEPNNVALLSLSINEAGTRAYLTGVWPPPYGLSATHGYLYVIDTQNRSQPTELGRYIFPLRGVVSSMFTSAPSSDDALVVLADGSWQNGACSILHILDTSNPSAIQEISTFSLPESSGNCEAFAIDVAIRGNLVYSTWLTFGVRAIDISDPTQPLQAGVFSSPQGATPWISDVALLGDNHVVATTIWWSGMYILSGPAP